jgi:hypothetical protein
MHAELEGERKRAPHAPNAPIKIFINETFLNSEKLRDWRCAQYTKMEGVPIIYTPSGHI